MSRVRLTLAEVRDRATRGLVRAGISDENAAVIADVMTTAERDGCESHGLFRMQGYCDCVQAGRTDGKAVPVLHDDAPGLLRVDAMHGFAAPAMIAGRPVLADKAREQGIAAFTRAVDGSAFREFRGEARVDADINQVMAVLDDTQAFTKWMYNCREAVLLYKPSMLDRYQYLLNDFPWPAADRAMVIRNQISQNPDTRVTRISLESAADSQLPEEKRENIPKVKGVKRVVEMKGFFELTPQSDGGTAVVFQLHLDPAGALPSGLVNSLIVDNPFETLKQLQVVVQQPQYQNFNPF